MEKPSVDQIDTRNISAGAYVLERSVLELLAPEQPASIERDVFPRLVGQGLYGHVARGYWMDIGTPERYLQATYDILEGTVATEVGARLGDGYLCVEDGSASDGRIVPAALVESGCTIGEGAHVGGRVVLQHDVSVGAGTTVEGSVLMRGATVGEGCTLRACLVGPGARIGDHCVVEGLSVLGERVTLGPHNVVANGALFTLYHLHQPWCMPVTFLDGVINQAWSSDRYRSTWMGLITHTAPSFLVGAILLKAVLS